MNKEELPLQVVQELKRILLGIKEIEDFDKRFILEPLEPFGFKITSRKESRFFFSASNYIVPTLFIIDNSVAFFTVICSGINKNIKPFQEESRTISFNSTITEVKGWTNLVQEYLDTDIQSLFKQPERLTITDTPDVYDEKAGVLDYALKSLAVVGYQGVKKTQIENLPIDTQWVFLVGENGFGKTTLLQAMLLGLHGTKDNATELVTDKAVQIKVEYKSEDSNIINDCWLNTHPLKHLAAYGPARLNLQADASENEVERKTALAYGLFETDGVLLNINAEFYRWALKKDKRFELMKKAFCTLIPYLADVRYNDKTDQIEYIEQDLDQQTYQALPFKKLASGFKSMLGIVGDMIIRLTRSQPNAKKPSDLRGIVLIDEIDLHFHPKLQKQLPTLLSKVFPKVQFIVSTHSPIPLLGAPHNSVILKVKRNEKDGVDVERVAIDLKYLTPNILLTSGVFDMEDFVSVQNDDLSKTRTENSAAAMQQNDEVEAYLKAFEAGNEQFPDNLFKTTAK
jgi:predicted ATPase